MSRVRTLGLSAMNREDSVTSVLRSDSVTSSAPSTTFPGGMLTSSRSTKLESAASLVRSTRKRRAARVTARYIAPVSRNRQPSRSANLRADRAFAGAGRSVDRNDPLHESDRRRTQALYSVISWSLRLGCRGWLPA